MTRFSLAYFIGSLTIIAISAVHALDFVSGDPRFEWAVTPSEVGEINYKGTGLILSQDESYVIVLGTISGTDKSDATEPQLADDQIVSATRNTRNDIVVYKRRLDSATPDWSFRTGSYVDDMANGGVVAGGFIWIVGAIGGGVKGVAVAGNRDAFLMKVTPEGERVGLWVWGSTGDDIAMDVISDGNALFIVGSTQTGIPGASGSVGGLSESFVIRFDLSTETVTDIVQSGIEEDDRATSVAIKNGKVYVGIEWQKPISDFTSGGSSQIKIGQWAVYVYNAADLAVSQLYKRQGGTAQESLVGIALDPQNARQGLYGCGNIIVKAAYTKEDIMARRYRTSSFEEVWRFIADSAVDDGDLNGGSDKVVDCTVTPQGNLVVLATSTGSFRDDIPKQSYPAGTYVVMVISPNENTILTVQSLGGDARDATTPAIDSEPRGILLTSSGRVISVGTATNQYRRSSIVLDGVLLPPSAFVEQPVSDADLASAATASPIPNTEGQSGTATNSPTPAPTSAVGENTSGQTDTGDNTEETASTKTTTLILMIVGGVAGIIGVAAIIMIVVVVRRRRSQADVTSMPSDGVVRRRTTGKMETIDLERGRNSAMPM